MNRLPPRFLRMTLLSGIVALGALSAAGMHSEGRANSSTDAHPPGAADSTTAALETRIARIEMLLGVNGRPADAQAPDALRPRYEMLRARTEVIAQEAENTWAGIPSISPVIHGTITSPYTQSRFHPIQHRLKAHFGLDIAAAYGSPILATARGTVVAVATTPSYGHAIDVDHRNGYITRYAHATRILAEEGDEVMRGDTIGLVGQTGSATGPHVHYEIFKDGWSVDPVDFLLDGRIDVEIEVAP